MELEEIKDRFGGRLDVTGTGPTYNEMMATLAELSAEWDPVGNSRQDVKAVMGDPTRETATELVYIFRSGRGRTGRRFLLEDDSVVEVQGYDGRNTWPLR